MKSSVGHSIRWGRRNGNERDVFYTPVELARLCVGKVPFGEGDYVLDPCSGKGSFFNCFPPTVASAGMDISDGQDFYKFAGPVDWCVSNPPYSHLDAWLDHTCAVSNKGFGYLLGWNNLTAKRIERCESFGFGITSLTMFKVFEWFGMSAFVVWERGSPGIIGFDRTVWRN